MPRDYYEVLGVDRSASKDDLRQAFRKLARQHHPDVNNAPDAEERFKEINEAYTILSDDNKRAAYDRFGHAGVNGGGGFPGGGFSGGFPGLDEILEMFGDLAGFPGFGGGRQRSRGPSRGRDLRYDMTIEFTQAVFGADIDIQINRRETCPTCRGRRAEPGTTTRTCPECKGQGRVQRQQQLLGANVIRVVDCPLCAGRGEMIDTPCHECRGQGIITRTRTLTVKIPPGVDNDMPIRLGGEGDPSPNGGSTGDLYVVLHVRPHEIFKRRNNDILVEVPINVAQAALGDEIKIPTVDGEAPLAVPAGTQSGDVIRLRNKGVPKLRRDGSASGRGDQLVIITVQIPTKLTKEQRQLFEQLGHELGHDVIPQKGGRGFLDRVADFLSGS
jgi:molecular chaperone DnaJ